ncbi:unnamed protein product [marine sediment metagenome]|uniref:ASCH domain-containing protein n=1 Tax=marine sediment metagenome TaxID=412755 RepID=X1KG00_9ZZZZ
MIFTHEYSILKNKIFTTIRRNTNFYKVGHSYQVHTPEQSFKAKVIKSEAISKLDINDSLAQSDADMSAVNLVALLDKWYGKTFDDFVLLTLERLDG